MILCICHGISYDEIKKLVDDNKSIEEIASICGAGSSCGICVKTIKQEIDERKRNEDE